MNDYVNDGEYYIYTYQLGISLIIVTAVSLFIKANLHLARSLVVLVFSILFYNVQKFTIFAGIIWLFLLGSTIYLDQDRKLILNGVFLGAISTIITYYILL